MSAGKILLALGVSMFWTVSAVWGQTDLTDRKPLAQAVFRNLAGTLDFLRGSPAFQSRLARDEASLLSRIVALFEEQSWDLAPKIRLEFSDNRSDFILNGVERAAKTSALRDDPVIFNLGLIQSPSFHVNALDMTQILVHEVAHKLNSPEAEPAIERLAAKVREGLAPYFQQFDLNPSLRVSSLILPKEHAPISLSSQQADPLILFEYRGRFIPAQFTLMQVTRAVLSRFWIDHESLWKAGHPSGNFQNQFLFKMSPLRVHQRENEIELTIPLEITETLTFVNPMSQGWDIVAGSQMMRPRMTTTTLADPARTLLNIERRTSLGWFENWGEDARQVNLNGPLIDRPEKYFPDVSGAQAEVSRDSTGHVTGTLRTTEPVTKVWLSAGRYLWPMEAKAQGDGVYTLSGDLTAPRAAPEKLEVSSLILNGSTRIPLPRPFDLNLEPGVPVGAAQGGWHPVQADAGDGAGWVELATLKGRDVSRLRLRINVSPSFGSPYQLQSNWTAPGLILWDRQKVAERHDEVIDVVARARLKRVEQDGQVWVEFDAREIFKSRPPDSLERVLNSIWVVDDKGESAVFSMRSETFRDRPFFKVIPCENLLNR